MRTTVTLDPELATRLKQLALRQRRSFKATPNDVLRRGLASQERTATPAPFVVEASEGGFRRGVDPAKLNQVLDQLEVEGFAGKASRGR